MDAKLGGWRSLAEKYPCAAKQTVHGDTWLGESITLANGGSDYRGPVIITAHSTGMRLQMPTLLRCLYPDVFLPWKDAVVVREPGWLWDKVHLTYSAVPDVPVTICASFADKILASVGPVWTEPRPPKKPGHGDGG